MSIGLYIHVPFCRVKCPYCDFYSVRFDPEVNREYVRTVIAELQSRGSFVEAGRLDSIFLGGGTPSLLPADDMDRILEAAIHSFSASVTEVTVECNPGTLNPGYLKRLKGAGVNRISLGVQSLEAGDLKVLGRSHTAEESVVAFLQAREAGIRNISVDLIFGIPGQTVASWCETLSRIVKLAPEHVSVYELTLDGPSPMAEAARSGAIRLLPESESEEMYRYAGRLLRAAGLEQYEISNFSRADSPCRHNLNCWDYGEYIGVGPSSHSFINGRRFWNAADMADYFDNVRRTGTGEAGSETLSTEEQEFDRTMLALRTSRGAVRDTLPSRMMKTVSQLVEGGLLEETADRVRLTARGILVSNEVFIRLR